MTTEDIQKLLVAISQILTAVKGFPMFESDSFYTYSDLTMSDAIQALDELAQGIEYANVSDRFSDLYLTPDLKAAIASLSDLGMAIIRADRANRPSENKAAAKEAARQDGHDISEWV